MYLQSCKCVGPDKLTTQASWSGTYIDFKHNIIGFSTVRVELAFSAESVYIIVQSLYNTPFYNTDLDKG